MPLTNTGKKVLGKFEKEYGKKGKSYFYGKENKSSNFAEAMTHALHKKSQTVDGNNYSYSGEKSYGKGVMDHELNEFKHKVRRDNKFK